MVIPRCTDKSGRFGVYLLACADGTYYTGMARDVFLRFEAHCSKRARCRYTQPDFRHPLRLAVAWGFDGGRSEAQQLEYRLRRLRHSQKKILEKSPEKLEGLLRASGWVLPFHTEAIDIFEKDGGNENDEP